MNMKLLLYIKSSIVCVLLTFYSYAQVDNTMYFMDRLPQANYINPAIYPEVNFFIGGAILPLVGQLPPPLMFAVNTPLAWGDVIFKGRWEYKDSLIHPLHPNADLKRFLKKIHSVNYVSSEVELNLLYFGFRQKKNFWSFDVSEHVNAQIGIPGELIKFPILGNAEVRHADFEGLSTNVFAYHQVAIGFKRQLTRYSHLGLKFKYLGGIANVYAEKSKITLETSPQYNHLHLSADYILRASLPVDFQLSSDGFIDDVNIVGADDDGNIDPVSFVMQNLLFSKNRGVAFDAGFSSEWNSELSYFVNFVDVGFIRWKNNAHTFSFVDNDVYTFKGVEITSIKNAMDSINFNMDSILNNLTYQSDNAYTTPLPYKIYVGANYKFTDKLNMGVVGRLEKMSLGYRPSATASLNYRPGKFGLLSLSYSIANYSPYNIGFGSTLRLGPVQWYFVSDNIIGTALFPHKSRSLSARIGCNLVFGYNPDGRPPRVLPMFLNNTALKNSKVPKYGRVNNRALKRKQYKMIPAPKN